MPITPEQRLERLKNEITKCPGMYCGRVWVPEHTNFSDCGPCPRGFRPNAASVCTPCMNSPVFYDWLFLGFIGITVSVLHCICIDATVKRRSFSKEVLMLHFCALVETVLSAMLAILIVEPVGTFTVTSCNPRQIADWYTVLHNPIPQYVDTVHCGQEAVYPLYTMVFLFYIFGIVLMLCLRPWVAARYVPGTGKMSIYAAMYFFPILLLIHAVLGGVIYYTFPYITIILSVVSSATHFAFKLDQSVAFLVFSTLTDLRNILILLGHWALHAYGIISITELTQPLTHCLLILLVPTPAIFYILTAKFTDPKKLHVD